MNHDFPNLDELTLAAKIRACADGELVGDECDQLKAYLADHPDAAKQLRFERELRSCCDRVMKSQPCCPDALRSKIAAMCGCPSDESDSDAGYAERIEASNKQTRSKSFWMRSSIISAAAAVLVITAGVLVFQAATFNPGAAPSNMTIQQANYIDRVGDFVLNEHKRCFNDDSAAAKLVRNDIEEAAAYFSDAFGNDLAVPDMASAKGTVVFYGGGDCHVPMTTRSGHLRFDALTDSGEPVRVSLFVSPMPQENLMPMEEGVTYRVRSKACDKAGSRLFAWTANGLMYLLVSEASDSMCLTVRDIMQAPSQLGEL
ncbi:MAG: hypothetical protein JKY96_06850 [Phycisphaerales bacterium]|nr:hypothetical protein [Phycisphaerales bacterium]